MVNGLLSVLHQNGGEGGGTRQIDVIILVIFLHCNFVSYRIE